MTRKYLGESHKKYSEACRKEVAEMSLHPLSYEQALAQVERNRVSSELQGKEEKVLDESKMTRKYLGESHKKYSESCQKEVEEMKKHPLSHEQFLEQIERNRRASELQGTPVPVPSGGVALQQKEKRRTLSPMMKELLSNPVIYSKEEIEADERLKEIIEG